MKFLFQVRVKPGHEEAEYVDAWQDASAVIQQQPGAQGTSLHRKVGDPGAFVAIATWDSSEARELAMKNLRRADDTTRKRIDKHWEIGEITVLGDFDESDWIVKPSK